MIKTVYWFCQNKGGTNMLKLLKATVSGYRMLEEGFTIDLLNKTKVSSLELEKDVLLIDKRLYTFKNFAFVGSNASGKSTTLTLLLCIYSFLCYGRWPYNPNDFSSKKITLHLEFFQNGEIYFYDGEIKKIENGGGSSLNIGITPFCDIANESLFKIKYVPTFGKAYEKHLEGRTIIPLENNVPDTSGIISITKGHVYIDDFENNNIWDARSTIVRNSFFDCLNRYDIALTSSILSLLDEGIEYIKVLDSDAVEYKRFNERSKIMNRSDLILLLSNGTIRGTELFIRAIRVLETGGVFLVDEIENCFHKNVVANVLDLFSDSTINKNGAQLIFSTHYSQILDLLNRRDSIFIMHQKDGKIGISNLLTNYKIRTELSKSIAFDNNVFDTLLKYDRLMKMRGNVVRELQTHHD